MIVITLNKYTVKVKVLFLFCLLGISCMLKAADKPIIKIETDCTSLIFQVGDNGRLYQRYLGEDRKSVIEALDTHIRTFIEQLEAEKRRRK